MSRYTGRYQVIGPPGTGKTTWLGKQVQACVGDEATVCVSSLTRAAAAEVSSRGLPIPADHVGTLHAHAYRAIGRPALYTEQLADWNERHPHHRMRDTKRVDKTGDDLLNTYTTDECRGDDIYEACDLRRHQQIPIEAWSQIEQEFYAAWCDWKAETETIDFTDMIERAAKETIAPLHTPDVLLADESQDLSALEYDLLCHWEKAARALIVVGDPYQALYTWRGAAPELFDDPTVPGDHRKVLSQSWRVPRAVHAAATALISRLSNYRPIEYKPRESDGVAKRFYDGTQKSPWAVVQAATEVAASGRTAMIIASCGYMLKSTIQLLREQGVPYANPWRTKRGDWNPLRKRKLSVTVTQRLLSFLKPLYSSRTASVWSAHDESQKSPILKGGAWTLAEFSQWTDFLSVDTAMHFGGKTDLKALAKEEPDRLVKPDDLKTYLQDEAFGVAVLMLAEDLTPAASVEWLRKNSLASKQTGMAYPLSVLEKSGPDALTDDPRIFVGTAHSFKGAQGDVVFIYPEVSTAAAEHAARYGEDDLIRTFYVAMTRAREEVHVCMKCDSRAVEIEL